MRARLQLRVRLQLRLRLRAGCGMATWRTLEPELPDEKPRGSGTPETLLRGAGGDSTWATQAGTLGLGAAIVAERRESRERAVVVRSFVDVVGRVSERKKWPRTNGLEGMHWPGLGGQPAAVRPPELLGSSSTPPCPGKCLASMDGCLPALSISS